MSLSGLAGSLGVLVGLPVGCAHLKFLTLPTDAGVAVSGAAVLVSVWDASVAPALAGKLGHLTSLVVLGGETTGFSG